PTPARRPPRRQRLKQPPLEGQSDRLAPRPAPAGRRLDRHGCDPASPWLGPPSQALPVSREPLLDHLPTIGIEHSRLQRALVNVDRRVHHEPPLVDTEARSSATVRTEPL